MRWYRAHLLARRKLFFWPWLAAAFACVFAGVGAVSTRATTCGARFSDPESSALLADVVLEGRIRERAVTPGTGWYNVTVQVRKDILKGGDLVNEGKKVSKLLIGKFLRENGVVSNEVSVRGGGGGGADDGGAGAGTGENDIAEKDWSDCVADVEDGATYIFFLRNVGKERGKYFEISALPVKKNRRESRLITKIIKSGGQKPSVQSIHGSKKVTEGSSLTLRCKAKAKPNPNYSWYRNGKELRNGKGLSIKNNKRGSRLKISKTQTGDDGVYECVADNALGTARKNVTVEVTAPQKIYKACEKQTYCFNGGTCRYIPELQQTFCECPAEWAGQRCELLDNLSVQDKYSRQSTLLYERTLIIFGIVIAVLVFLVICIASYFLANRRRKRSEANKRKMKRDGDPESDRLLPDKAEASSKGQHALNYSPSTHQATQTEADAHLPDPLTKFTSNVNRNFLHLDRTFPMVSSVVTAPVAAPPSVLANGQRSGHRTPDRDPLERREPRHRLKAAPEDDNVTETRTPVGVTAPITTGGNSPEIVELTATEPDPTDQRRFLGPEHEKQGGWTPETFSSLIAFPDISAPLRMEVRPTANVYAQMKPLAKATNAPNAVLHTPPSKDAPNTVKVVDVSFPDTPPMNGVLIGDSDNEGELPRLHISEEDLTRNVHKPQKPLPGGGLSSPLAPPTVSLTPASPARTMEPRPDSFPSQFPMGGRAPPNSSSLSDDDSGGFSVRNLSGSEAPSPPYFSSAATTRPCHYAFDPTADSDPSELLDEFMHVPPNTYLTAGLDDRRELRLRDVRDNQEAIPI